MKYIVMMHVPTGGPYRNDGWSRHDFERHNAFMNAFAKGLRQSGEFVAGEALRAPDEAKRVHASDDGLPITDGVFPESKEFLAGFWVVEVPSAERAYAIAAQVSDAPGPGGAPLKLVIEVRRMFDDPPNGRV
jgi:hypothetical protein